MAAAHDRGQAPGQDGFLDLVHLGETDALAGFDHESAEGEAGVQLDVLGAHHARVLHGPFGRGHGVGAGVAQHGPVGGGGQHLGVHLGRRQSAHQVLGGTDLLPAVAAGQGLHQPGALDPEPGGAQRVLLLLQQVQGPLGDLQGAFAFPAAPPGDRRLGHRVEIAQRGGGGVVGLAAPLGQRRRIGLGVVDGAQGGADAGGGGVPEFHRAFQQPELFGVGAPAAGGDGGVQDGGQGLGRVVGVVPVAGQPHDAFAGRDERRVGFEGFGVAAVEAGAFAGQQVVGDGLADQGVPEAVAVVAGRDGEDAGVDGGPQRLDQIVLGEVGDGGEQPVLDGGAALGDEPGDPLGALGQPFDTDEEEVAQGVGEAGAAALVGGDGEFLDEEGVPVGAFEDRVDLGRVGFAGEDAGDLAADLVAGEAAELDTADGAQPVEFGEEGAQRVTAVDVVGAVGGEDDEAAGAQGAEEVGQQVAGGGVGPVQVLQGDDDGAVGGEAFQEAGGEFEEAGHALLAGAVRAEDGGGLADLGQQPGQFVLLSGGGRGQLVGQLPAQGAQRGGEGGERKAVGADLDAAAEGDDGARAGGGAGELLDEAGLADARLAADDQRLRLARGGTGERVVQRLQLGGAADEHGTYGAALHGPEHRTRRGRRGTGFPGAVPGSGVPRPHAARAVPCRPGRALGEGVSSAFRAGRWAARRWARRTRTASRTRRWCSAWRISSSVRRWCISCSKWSNMVVSPWWVLVVIASCDASTFVSQGGPPHRESAASCRAGGCLRHG